jgi:hypothetical protein
MVSCALLVGVAGCGDDSVGSTWQPEVVSEIQLDRTSLVVAVREYVQVTAHFRDAAGRTLVGVTGVTWVSGDPSIVAVDSGGRVSGVAFGGPVRVTVTSLEGVSAGFDVTVRPIPVAEPFVGVGRDSAIALSVALRDYLGATVSSLIPQWTSANPAIVSVQPDGRLFGANIGTTQVSTVVAGIALHTSVEVGVPHSADGVWSGTNPTGHSVTLVVLFGAARRFASALTFLGGCTVPYTADGFAPLVDGRFLLALPYGTSVTGSFAEGELTLTTSQIAPPASQLREWCPLLIQAIPIPPSEMLMVRSSG